MFLPIQIPAAIESQRSQGSRSITGLLAPMHALVLLSACDNQVIAFFDVGAADVLSLGTALPIVGNKRLALLQVLDQLVEFFGVLGLWAVLSGYPKHLATGCTKGV